MNRNKKYPYEEYHKEIDGVLYKKCAYHDQYFADEDPWLPCNSEYYYKNKSNSIDGFYPDCKRCETRKSVEWGKNHRDKRLIYLKKDREKPERKKQFRKNIQRLRDNGYYDEYYLANPDKYKQYNKNHRNHDITKSEEQSLLKVFDYKCAYCNMTLDEHKRKYGEKLHNDHVDYDGYNDLRNDVPACKNCNTSKWQFNMEDWYKQQEFFSIDNYNKIIWWTTEGYKDYIEDKLSYKILRKRNENDYEYHYELWSLNEKRNVTEFIISKPTRVEIKEYIKDNNIK